MNQSEITISTINELERLSNHFTSSALKYPQMEDKFLKKALTLNDAILILKGTLDVKDMKSE